MKMAIAISATSRRRQMRCGGMRERSLLGGVRHRPGAGRSQVCADGEPGAIIARLMDAVPPGSYLALSQIAGDVAAEEVAQGVQRYNEQAAAPVAARTHAEVCRFFAGLDLVEPGVVQVHRWRPGAGDLSGGRDLAIYAGVGRKP